MRGDVADAFWLATRSACPRRCDLSILLAHESRLQVRAGSISGTVSYPWLAPDNPWGSTIRRSNECDSSGSVGIPWFRDAPPQRSPAAKGLVTRGRDIIPGRTRRGRRSPTGRREDQKSRQRAGLHRFRSTDLPYDCGVTHRRTALGRHRSRTVVGAIEASRRRRSSPASAWSARVRGSQSRAP